MNGTAQPTLPPLPEIRAAVLAGECAVDSELEFYFARQIAACQLTIESLQRNIDELLASADIDHRKLDSLSRSQARAQRMQIAALKELKDLQSRRNVIERFPEQTEERPPLADHFCYIGERPIVTPPSPPPPSSRKEGRTAHLLNNTAPLPIGTEPRV